MCDASDFALGAVLG